MKFSELPYKRVDFEEIEKIYEDLIQRAEAAKSGEELFAVHKERYEMQKEVSTNFIIAHIRRDLNTADEFYTTEMDYYDEKLPVLSGYDVRYEKILYDSPYREFLEEKLGKVTFKNMELSFKSFDEKLIPLSQEENQLVSRYTKLIASAKIPFQGEEYNLSLMTPFTTSKDREVRKSAWKAVSEYFLSVTDEIDEIYDLLVKNRTEQARMMGYENFVELGYYRMGRNCYDQEMVDNFRKQVKQYFVPFVEKLHQKRKNRLGLDALKYYDSGVYFENGNPTPSGTPEEILQAGQEMYHELSKETAEFFDYMMGHELFEVLGKKNKRAGGYMTFISEYKFPFIFANFNGTSGDVNVITHECGHAFQRYLVRNEEIEEFTNLTMETAEIHSMAMEYFTYQWMEKFFGERGADYRDMHFMDSVIFIPYGSMVDEFQHIVYANPDMTPAERKAVWAQLEKEYRPSMDYEDDAFFATGGFWQKQGHIFQSPFYYIDYVLAGVCAMQFKGMMEENFKDAWERYMTFCKMAARDFFVQEIAAVGLASPFEDGCMKKLVASLGKGIEF